MQSQKLSTANKVLLVLIGLGALVWIAGETHFYFGKADPADTPQLITQSLEGAANTFEEEESRFLDQTRRLADRIKPLLTDEPDYKRIFGRLETQDYFWGTLLFKNGKEYIWSGNPVEWSPDAPEEPFYTTLQQIGNNTFFVGQYLLEVDSENEYILVTTRLLKRVGSSPQLLTDNVDIPQQWASQQPYPVRFSFFVFEEQPDTSLARALNTVSVDSVGLVTASPADFPQLERQWHRQMVTFRYYMLAIGIILFYLLIISLSSKLAQPIMSLLAASLTGLVWTGLSLTGIPVPRLFPDVGNQYFSAEVITTFTDSLFLAVITLTIMIPLFRNREKIRLKTGLPEKAGWGFGHGLMAAWIAATVSEMVLYGNAGILSLQVLPEWNTWMAYITALLLFGSYLTAVWIVLRVRFSDDSGISIPNLSVYALFWLIALFVYFYLSGFFPGMILLIWLISFHLLILALIFFSSVRNDLRIPKLRLITFGVLLVTAGSLPFLYSAEITRENKLMETMAREYAATDDIQAEIISYSLLNQLSEDPVIQQIREIDAAPSFPIHSAAQFRQRINRLISPEWNSYTILAFLLDGRLNVITDYGSKPEFSERYAAAFHDEAREYVRNSLFIPIAQLPLVESDPRFKGFPIFYKGLQSIPSELPSQPSWIVTFVLVEGNTFGRPVHDALVYYQREEGAENRFIITEYINGQKSRTTAGIQSPAYTTFQRLPSEWIPDEAGNASIFALKSPQNQRQVIYRFDDNTVIVASVRNQTILNFIFSGFRYFTALLLLCLLVYFVWHFFTEKSVRILSGSGGNERFNDRILDSYLIATLVFIIVLALVTEHIVGQQNLRIASQELSRNLQIIENRIANGEPSRNLEQTIDAEEIDVILYKDRRLFETTAPEIFRQQLVSTFLPYDIYYQLMHEQNSVAYKQMWIGEMPVLMGFRSMFDDDGNITQVIATPAYTRSAIYEDEFLQTTSYLIAFYIIIFGFFTGVAFLLSRKLTEPLSAFQSGLKRISSGDLNTTIPVTSDDEIGELARAYNEMVNRLKTLQKELAEAERDAAWSEMARQIAHEIKNPLTPMKLSIQHLQRQIASGEQSVEDLRPRIQKLTELLVNQIDSLNTIASDFSRFAKPLAGTFEKTDLNKLVSSVLELFENLENVEFRFEQKDEEILVNVIPDEIRRVCINLIKNSIEAMPDGGVISINTVSVENKVHLYISDTGTGIKKEHADRIFTPNFSTKTSGTGLGLAICRKILEAHNGDISFSTSDGEGTTFEVALGRG